LKSFHVLRGWALINEAAAWPVRQRAIRVNRPYQFTAFSCEAYPLLVFYFEDYELVVFMIVMSPPPLAVFFGLKSRS
jgi:hypothetical protein